ncbi:phosphoglycerate dehydrogenase [Endomicrobium proavitum]|uniref:D-3-phosphoglycerate dehydrogenase n=1 Tax=Endomicrobium proavitum TaxID=1408281 RepID=A0A0G3WJQ0_9BACT|nr:phosphoglycerate dehydrogenase [Endomicrobium proavitum]AKL97724.1 D-3-phosphoglycerate dehydrogenase [Endomicrobium proavitum]
MYKILMTYDSMEGLDTLVANKEFKIEVHAKPSAEDFKKLIKDYDGLLIRSEVKVTAEIIEAAEKLKFIGRAGTGVDNVDKAAATQKGIVVANVPGGNTISVAEHTIGLILSMARSLPDAVASMKNKKWEKKKFMGNELFGKTLGLIGLGRIGTEVAKRLISFGMKVVAYDPFANADLAKSNGIELTSLDDVFAKADYLSIHSPLTDDTRGMINNANIAKMKDGVRIVNCARGAIINDKDLSEALKSGKVANAALDVFVKEPPEDWSLIETQNLLATPHLAASTEEAQVKIAQEMSEVIVDFFTKGLIRNAVNVPTVDWETYKKMKPYIELASKTGSFQGQIIEGAITEIQLGFYGSFSNYNTNSLTVAYLEGLLTPILDIKVNSVNAPSLAKERGIKIKEVIDHNIEDYAGILVAKIKTEKGENSFAATLFEDNNPRIVKINGLNVDVIPAGGKLLITNDDKPGVIGKVASLLGEEGVNIAGMNVGRKEVGGEALTIIAVDSKVSAQTLEKFAKIAGVKKAKFVSL